MPLEVASFAPTTRIQGQAQVHHRRSDNAVETSSLLQMAANNKNKEGEKEEESETDHTTWVDKEDESISVESSKRRDLIYNGMALGVIGASGLASLSLVNTNLYTPSGFTRIPTQFVAALGDPKAKEGTSAQDWGLWKVDPGPRGVWLRDYQKDIMDHENRVAPAGWTFDSNDWWLEEHGLIMEAPKFSLAPGRYLVTGGRMVTTGLTIDAATGSWKLDEGTLYDVTHLPCRSARYTPILMNNGETITTSAGSPLTANPKDFPVAPGAIMPSVPGCAKQDYAVLFVVGKAS
jgi:hypothetical protein